MITSKKIFKKCLFHLSRCNFSRPVAYLLNRITEVIKKGNSSTRPIKRVLIMNTNKDGVLQDIKYCFLEDDSFELICWPSFVLNSISSALLAPGLTNNRYLTTNPAVEATKVKYKKFLVNVWRHYIAARPVAVVISVNFGYYVQREFAAALEEVGTPFIVLQKENLNGITPRRAEFWRTVYSKGRGKFSGRKILVYNNFERELEISSGIVEPERVIVTGMPRLDAIHRWRREYAGQPCANMAQPKVLFFTFTPKDKIPHVVSKKRSSRPRVKGTSRVLEKIESDFTELDWEQLCVGTHEAILEFARARPDVQIIVKTKRINSQKSIAINLLKRDGKMPSNLKIICGGDPFRLLIESSVVVGFNTTGLLEALAVGKPVIVPCFGEARKKELKDLILDLATAVEYAHSPKELTELISKNLEYQVEIPLDLSANSSKVLRRFLGNDDGHSGTRVLDAIGAEIHDG